MNIELNKVIKEFGYGIFLNLFLIHMQSKSNVYFYNDIFVCAKKIFLYILFLYKNKKCAYLNLPEFDQLFNGINKNELNLKKQ